MARPPAPPPPPLQIAFAPTGPLWVEGVGMLPGAPARFVDPAVPGVVFIVDDARAGEDIVQGDTVVRLVARAEAVRQLSLRAAVETRRERLQEQSEARDGRRARLGRGTILPLSHAAAALPGRTAEVVAWLRKCGVVHPGPGRAEVVVWGHVIDAVTRGATPTAAASTPPATTGILAATKGTAASAGRGSGKKAANQDDPPRPPPELFSPVMNRRRGFIP